MRLTTCFLVLAACGTARTAARPPETAAVAAAETAPAPESAPVPEATEVAVAPDAVEPSYPTITTAELKALVGTQPLVLLDATGSDDFAVAHLPGAIDFHAAADELAEVLPASKDVPVVTYCGDATCEGWRVAADAVAALGYTKVHHFVNGVSGWQAEQGPVESTVR